MHITQLMFSAQGPDQNTVRFYPGSAFAQRVECITMEHDFKSICLRAYAILTGLQNRTPLDAL